MQVISGHIHLAKAAACWDSGKQEISLSQLISEKWLVINRCESWMPKNWCFWTVLLEKTLESPLDCKEIKLVNTKGNPSWIFIRGKDAKTEAPILWPLNVKRWLIRKDPDAGKDGRQEEKRTTEDSMVRWHHWLNRHEFEQAPGVEGLGSLVCAVHGLQRVRHDGPTEQQLQQCSGKD